MIQRIQHHYTLRILKENNETCIFLFFFIRVRSLKLSTARILTSHGADPNVTNNRGETALALTEHLQPDQRQSFINALVRKFNRIECF